jgi:hypothetical protein
MCKSPASKTRDYGTIVIQLAQVSREPLDRFKAAVGGRGSVRGPYGPYSTTKQAYYNYTASGGAAIEVFDLLKPFLCSVKISDGDAAKAAYYIDKQKPRLGNGMARRRELAEARLANG